MSILFVAPSGVDTNSDRARTVAKACPSIEVRDIDLDRLHDMPPQLTGVPTLVTDDDVLKGTDCLAALVDSMQPAAPARPAVPAAPANPQMPPGPLNEKTSSFTSESGPVKSEDIQNMLNQYRQEMR